jgi:hypothetical protein
MTCAGNPADAVVACRTVGRATVVGVTQRALAYTGSVNDSADIGEVVCAIAADRRPIRLHCITVAADSRPLDL